MEWLEAVGGWRWFAIGLAYFAGGALAWRRIAKMYPELKEFKHFGLACLLTGGIPLLGVWLYLLTDLERIKQEDVLKRWLVVPLSIFGGTFALDIVSQLLFPEHWHLIVDKLISRADGVAGLYLLVSGWKSSEPLARIYARNNLLSALVAILALVIGVLGFAGLTVKSAVANVIFVPFLLAEALSVYFLAQSLLAMLLAGTRGASRPKHTMWLPLLGASIASLCLPFVASFLHVLLATLAK